MARVKRGVAAHRRHRSVLKQVKGHRGTRNRLYKRAHESLMHALKYAYRDRRNRKRDMRRLWIVRINAAARLNGLSYSRLIQGLTLANVAVDRKMLTPDTLTVVETLTVDTPAVADVMVSVQLPAAFVVQVLPPTKEPTPVMAPVTSAPATGAKVPDALLSTWAVNVWSVDVALMPDGVIEMFASQVLKVPSAKSFSSEV